jgi:hypothetical protein
MNRILIVLFFALALENLLLAQANDEAITIIMNNKIAADSVNHSPNGDFEKRIKINPIDQSDNEFEIRYYKHFSLSNTKNLKIIKYNKGKWQVVLYEEWNRPVKIKKRALTPTSEFDAFVKFLIDKNILSLPDQSQLYDRMKKTTTLKGRPAFQKILVADGYSYSVEIKQGDAFRIYCFSNPKSYADFYDHIPEFKDYVAIVNAFEEQLIKK